MIYPMIHEGRAHSTEGTPDISIIIPMYNEQENAEDTIRRVSQTMLPSGKSFEIIPVNDGSTDRTFEILTRIALVNGHVRVGSYGKNGGRGKALRHGLKIAHGRYVATIDADLSYDPKYILEMARALDEEGEVDVVLASAYMEGGNTEGVPRDRLFISRMGNKILKAALPEDISTLTCIVRCYRREVIDSLDLESDGKEIHLEILSKVLAMGYKVKEIPATLTSRKKGKSKFAFRATAISHIVFTVFERPSLLFGLLGMLLTLIGLCLGTYILVLYSLQALNPTRPLLTLMVLFILGGMQILSFGFLASQINFLRKDVLLNRKALAQINAHRNGLASPDGEKPPLEQNRP
jgi:dolichol-phosphate mannosyltransferase